MKTVLVILVLGTFVSLSAVESFAPPDWNVVAASTPDWIKKHPARNEYWTSGGQYDAATGARLTALPTEARNYNSCVTWDDAGNVWAGKSTGFGAAGGLYRVKEVAGGTVTSYTTANGLPSNNITSVEFDRQSRKLVVGTGADLAVTTLDAQGNPGNWVKTTGYGFIHKVGIYNGRIWAVNAVKVHCFFNDAWTFYDSTNSPIKNPYGAFIDHEGNFWVGCGEGSLPVKPFLAKWTASSQSWEKIDLSSISEASGFSQIAVEKNGNLWLTSDDYLSKIDLNSGSWVAEKYVRYNQDPLMQWLDPAGELPLAINSQGNLVIGGKNYFFERVSSSAVKNRLAVYRPNLSASQTVGVFSLNGRQIAGNPFSTARSGQVLLVRTIGGQAFKSLGLK